MKKINNRSLFCASMLATLLLHAAMNTESFAQDASTSSPAEETVHIGMLGYTTNDPELLAQLRESKRLWESPGHQLHLKADFAQYVAGGLFGASVGARLIVPGIFRSTRILQGVLIGTTGLAAGTAAALAYFIPDPAHAATVTEYYRSTPEAFREFLKLPEDQQLSYAERDPKLKSLVVAMSTDARLYVDNQQQDPILTSNRDKAGAQSSTQIAGNKTQAAARAE